MSIFSKDFARNIVRGLKLVRIINFNPGHKIGPLSADISVTSRCNYKCFFCRHHSKLSNIKHKTEELSSDVIDNLFKDLIELKVREILFSGHGEPLLVKQLPELIKKYSKKIKVKLLSNGSTLSRITPELFKNLYKLTISLNSIDNETHKKIHCYEGESKLPQIMENIKRLLTYKKARDKIQINYILTKDNISEFDRFIKIIKKWDIFFMMRPIVVDFKAIDISKPAEREMQSLIKKAKHYLSKVKCSERVKKSLENFISACCISEQSRKSLNNLYPCYFGFYWAEIWADGSYIPCCFSRRAIGNIKENRFIELWKSTAIWKILYELTSMHESKKAFCNECYNCVGAQMQSADFHKVFTRLPLQTKLLRHNKNMLDSKLK